MHLLLGQFCFLHAHFKGGNQELDRNKEIGSRQLTSLVLNWINAKPRGSPRFGPRVCQRKSSATIFPYGENILIRAALDNNHRILITPNKIINFPKKTSTSIFFFFLPILLAKCKELNLANINLTLLSSGQDFQYKVCFHSSHQWDHYDPELVNTQ